MFWSALVLVVPCDVAFMTVVQAQFASQICLDAVLTEMPAPGYLFIFSKMKSIVIVN